jgi:hypothetical protein
MGVSGDISSVMWVQIPPPALKINPTHFRESSKFYACNRKKREFAGDISRPSLKAGF